MFYKEGQSYIKEDNSFATYTIDEWKNDQENEHWDKIEVHEDRKLRDLIIKLLNEHEKGEKNV